MSCSKYSNDNLILKSDSYKYSHAVQYPAETTEIYSYFAPRGGKYSEVCFVGLQIFIQQYLVGKVITKEKIDDAEDLLTLHLGKFDRSIWDYIVDKHCGILPIRIKALPEGTCINNKNVLFTIVNTDPKCFWLTNFLETILSQVWYPMTVATNSREAKKVILKYLLETGTLEEIGFKLHDFGYRGVSSDQSAGHGGFAHLTQFLGTDNMASLIVAANHYDCECAGFSIAASEHSTMTSWGKNGESKAYENMLKQFPNGLVACVSDSYDIFNAIKIWGTDHKETIMNRDGTLVIRPDSGDPPTIDLQILQELEKYFPVKVNDKGYKVLDNHIRIIQGDGIDLDMIEKILKNLKENGWSADNIAFGSGGGLLQKGTKSRGGMNRDTLKCACKCSHAIINGEGINVFKDPITDPGKKSHKGYVSVHKLEDGTYETRDNGNHDFETDVLVDVFENGKLLRKYTLEEIRERCEIIN
jgi:nicotinamide phosphoribosyltransferase